MIGASVRTTKNKDMVGGVSRGVERYLLDGAQEGANVALENTPSGASNMLRASWVEPKLLGDGSVVWGYNAPYAKFVEEGTAPHWAPIKPLLQWARRVLGDEQAAYKVQWKIAREGTEGQHFVRKGIRRMRTWFSSKPVTAYIEEEL